MSQSRKNNELPQRDFPLSRFAFRDPLKNASNGRALVVEPHQDGDYVLIRVPALQQRGTVQFAYILHAKPERQRMALESPRHGERRSSDIQDDLPRKLPELPKNGEPIFSHAERHVRIVGALQFHLDDGSVRGLADHVRAQGPDFRQFDVMPSLDHKTG